VTERDNVQSEVNASKQTEDVEGSKTQLSVNALVCRFNRLMSSRIENYTSQAFSVVEAIANPRRGEDAQKITTP
jgi:hypothetical protein